MKKKYSINRRITAILLLCFLLPFLFQNIQISGSMNRLVEEKVLKIAYKSMENSALHFSNALQAQFDMAYYFKSDGNVTKAVSKMEGADDKLRYQLQQGVLFKMVKENHIEKYHYPFYFILLDYQGNMMTNYTYSPYGGYDEVYSRITECSWFSAIRESYTDMSVMFSGEDFLNPRGTGKLYTATNVFTDRNEGILIIATDEGYLTSQFYDVLPGAASFIVDEEGNCLVAFPDSGIKYNRQIFHQAQELKQQIEKEGLVITNLESDSKNQYVMMQKAVVVKGASGTWSMLSVAPVESIMGDVKQIKTGNRIVLLCYLIAIAGTILLLKKTIVKPVLSLCQSMNEVRKGNLKVKIEEMPNNELGELGNGFNMMVENLDASFENLKKSEELNRVTEIRLLQNQIKPHFVRNVLNTIRWLAEMNGVTSVSKSILALSSLLEYNFKDSNLFSTVSEEINYVRKYMYLQKLRFQNKFKDEYDMEEDLYNQSILKLSFQPIVENSIYHGLLNQEGLGTICIRGRKNNQVMEFWISDNGIGMSQEKAEAILCPPSKAGIYESSEAVENIALWNIHQRIQQNYGQAYGLAIKSRPGEGTTVIMRIPFQKTGDKPL